MEVCEIWGSRSSVTADTHCWDVALSFSILFVLEIGLLHLQLFVNSHVHFCMTVELVIFQVLVHWPKRSSSTCATFTSFLLLGHLLQYSLWISVWSCSDCLHHFVTCCTLIVLSPLYLSITWYLILMGRNMVCAQGVSRIVYFFNGPGFQCCCHCTSVYPSNSIWFAVSCDVCCLSPP
jgi:hypothetical protein